MYQASVRFGPRHNAAKPAAIEINLSGLGTVIIPVAANNYRVLYLETVLRYGTTVQPSPKMYFSVGGVLDIANHYGYSAGKNDPGSGFTVVEATSGAGTAISMSTPPHSGQTAGAYQTTRYEIYNPNDAIYKNILGQINDPITRAMRVLSGFWTNAGIIDGIQINLGVSSAQWDANSYVRLSGEV
jgi:hypothetical protein